MDWLSQNWIWIAIAIGGVYFMTRMHGMGGGMGRSMRRGQADEAPPDQGRSLGITFDPVSRHAVAPGGSAASAVYHGRAYYFENREDRDTFEADPEKYIASAPEAGQPIGSENPYRQRRRRGGC